MALSNIVKKGLRAMFLAGQSVPIVLHKRSGGTYDPLTDTTTGETETTYNLRALFITQNVQDMAASVTIQETPRCIINAEGMPASVRIDPQDKITGNGQTYFVTSSRMIPVGGMPMVHDVTLTF